MPTQPAEPQTPPPWRSEPERGPTKPRQDTARAPTVGTIGVNDRTDEWITEDVAQITWSTNESTQSPHSTEQWETILKNAEKTDIVLYYPPPGSQGYDRDGEEKTMAAVTHHRPVLVIVIEQGKGDMRANLHTKLTESDYYGYHAGKTIYASGVTFFTSKESGRYPAFYLQHSPCTLSPWGRAITEPPKFIPQGQRMINDKWGNDTDCHMRIECFRALVKANNFIHDGTATDTLAVGALMRTAKIGPPILLERADSSNLEEGVAAYQKEFVLDEAAGKGRVVH